MTAGVEILRFAPVHVESLTRLFASIAADPASHYFHPHPFSEAEAERICRYGGKDIYVGLRCDGGFLGYGMLRGWDKGFTVPSLGIYVVPELRGTGAARLLMHYMHLVARLSGARQIRLKVYKENTSALGLYQSMGYVFTESNDPENQLVGIFCM